MANQQIQQLEHDGTRLFCPVHPKRKLEKAKTESEHGAFSIVCTAPGDGGACMRSAQWPTEAQRDFYFGQTSEVE